LQHVFGRAVQDCMTFCIGPWAVRVGSAFWPTNCFDIRGGIAGKIGTSEAFIPLPVRPPESLKMSPVLLLDARRALGEVDRAEIFGNQPRDGARLVPGTTDLERRTLFQRGLIRDQELDRARCARQPTTRVPGLAEVVAANAVLTGALNVL
jgi:hypothetical protein